MASADFLEHMNERLLVLEQNSAVQADMDKLSKRIGMIEDNMYVFKDTLNLKEAARYLDISTGHLYKLVEGRFIAHFKPRGKKIYFRKDDLDEWLQRNRIETVTTMDASANLLLKRDINSESDGQSRE